jgi:2'-5' RNA ligase
MDLSFPLKSAFLAIPLEGFAKEKFIVLQKELDEFSDFLKFQNPKTPHLTLYYWKELMEIEYNEVLQKTEKVAERTVPFTLHVNGGGTFGKSGDERVLYLSVAFSPELGVLKKSCPWPNPPDQPFSPHITVARISHAQKFMVYRKQIMKTFHNISFDVPANLLRFYAKIDGERETPLHDYPIIAAN